MHDVVRLTDHKRRASVLHFNRTELNQLLGVYSVGVIGGDWRDYAISHGPGFAQFCIYRHTHERPLFTVTKMADSGKNRSNARQGRYVVKAQDRKLSQGNSLLDVLRVFRKSVRLVSS